MSFHSLSLIFSLHVDNYGKCVTLWCWKNIFITQFLCSSSYVFLCAGRVLLPATSTDDVKGMSSFNDLKTVEECAKFHEVYQQTGLFLWDCTWQHKTIALTRPTDGYFASSLYVRGPINVSTGLWRGPPQSREIYCMQLCIWCVLLKYMITSRYIIKTGC